MPNYLQLIYKPGSNRKDSAVASEAHSSQTLQYAHLDICNSSSMIEMVQSKVNYNQELRTHKFTHCKIKLQKFYSQSLIHLQILAFLSNNKFYLWNLIRLQ